MAFHINDKGEPGKCSATQGKCPYGGEHQHYPSAEVAQKAYELSMAAQAMAAPVKKTVEAKANDSSQVFLGPDQTSPEQASALLEDYQLKRAKANGALENLQKLYGQSKEIRQIAFKALNDARANATDALSAIEERGLGYMVPDSGPTLRVKNMAQKVLLEEELMGQISDGKWENTMPNDHWKVWADATVIVDPQNVGRNFYAQKDNYQLNATDLLDIVGDRMVESVQKREPGYTKATMMNDLRELRKTFKSTRKTHDEEAARAQFEAALAAAPAAPAASPAPAPRASSPAGTKSSYGTGAADHSSPKMIAAALAGPGSQKPPSYFVGIHSGMANPVSGDGDEYGHVKAGGAVILARRDGTGARVVAGGAETYDDPGAELGRPMTMVKQKVSGRDSSTPDLYVMGYVDSQGNKYGWVPNKKIQYFVAK